MCCRSFHSGSALGLELVTHISRLHQFKHETKEPDQEHWQPAPCMHLVLSLGALVAGRGGHNAKTGRNSVSHGAKVTQNYPRSVEKVIAPTPTAKQMKRVCRILSPAWTEAWIHVAYWMSCRNPSFVRRASYHGFLWLGRGCKYNHRRTKGFSKSKGGIESYTYAHKDYRGGYYG